MGVSGSGKTTVGSLLATSLGWEFADADEYHSRENVEKMSLGVPLTDVDRVPWLQSLRARIGAWLDSEKDAVLACSALRQTYRNQLRINEDVHFVYLKGTPDLLAERLLERRDHYMKPSILQTHFSTLSQPPDP